jgi:hypothetical protein
MILAHGGIPGLIAETLIGVTVAALLGSIWLRERRRRARGSSRSSEHRAPAKMRDGE